MVKLPLDMENPSFAASKAQEKHRTSGYAQISGIFYTECAASISIVVPGSCTRGLRIREGSLPEGLERRMKSTRLRQPASRIGFIWRKYDNDLLYGLRRLSERFKILVLGHGEALGRTHHRERSG